MSSLNTVEVHGRRYSVLECVYVRPWPDGIIWVARIEEILARISNSNKIQHWLGVRWFYRRSDLLPSGEAEFPPCTDEAREVYLFKGKLDEVLADKVTGGCRVLCASEVPNLQAFLGEPDTYFYRYEYNPFPKERGAPLFTLPGGAPLRVSLNGGHCMLLKHCFV